MRKTIATSQKGSPLQRLVRALNAARQRALYWSGNASYTGKRFVPGRRGRKNHDLEYEMALDDIDSLSMDIERLTGKKLKRYDPRADERKRWSALNARLVERAGQERPNAESRDGGYETPH